MSYFFQPDWKESGEEGEIRRDVQQIKPITINTRENWCMGPS